MLRVIVCEIYVTTSLLFRVFVGKTLFRCVITPHCPRHNERERLSIDFRRSLLAPITLY